MPASGRLLLCATPIGNLEDVTLRALRLLGEADVVACEDTRRTRKLLTRHGVGVKKLVVYNDANERRRAPELLERMIQGVVVALVSDAGMPGLSDPGYRLVRACIGAGVSVEVVPGPTAVVSALVVSGLPVDRFAFEGFLPRKRGERRRRIEALVPESRTIVVYVSPHRLEEQLIELLEGLGDRPAVLARELTKIHEEVQRGSLSELLERVRSKPLRGEIVLVLGGASPSREVGEPAELARRARELMATGIGRREALSRVAAETGAARRLVFDALVERGGEES